MNIHKPTKDNLSWEQWVAKLTKENLELKQKNEQQARQISELKRRCCDLFSEVIEAKASNGA